MTNERCRELICEAGVNPNPLSGIKGMYFTTEREEDLRALVIQILKERKEEESRT